MPRCPGISRLLMIGLIGCSASHSVTSSQEPGSGVLGIPFELDDNLIYVRVSVNGSVPLSFILDTGAPSIVHTRLARPASLSLKLVGQSTGIGASQQDVYVVSGVVSFQLPGIAYSPQRLLATSLDAVEACVAEITIDEQGRNVPPVINGMARLKRRVDGILGREFFDRFVVEIDYGRRRLNLYDPSSYRYVGTGERVPLEVRDPHVFARGLVTASGADPVSGRFLVDTGSGLALTVVKSFSERHNLMPDTEGMTRLPVCGIGGHTSEVSWLGIMEELRLGNVSVARPVTEFRLSAPNTDADGFIGGAALRRFNVVFDYSRRVMILEPRSDR